MTFFTFNKRFCDVKLIDLIFYIEKLDGQNRSPTTRTLAMDQIIAHGQYDMEK